MANLSTKIKLYCKDNDVDTVDFTKDVRLLKQPSKDVIIESWNIEGLAKPTNEQLATYESAATTEENNNAIIANRKSEYGSNTHQIENIIENGLEAEQTRVQSIKDKYPKENS